MRNMFRLVVLTASALVLVFSLAACSQPNTSSSISSTGATSSAAAEDESAGVATVNVIGKGDVPIIESQVKLDEGATALAALQGTGLQVTVTDSSYGPFVEAIDGIANDESSGWTYTVNGESPSVSAGDYVVSDGDEVVWSYYQAA